MPGEARIPELEIPLIAKIRKHGSQALLNALEDCEIRVQGCGQYAYTLILFPFGYTKELERELCAEVEFLGFYLDILGCRPGRLAFSFFYPTTDSDTSTR